MPVVCAEFVRVKDEEEYVVPFVVEMLEFVKLDPVVEVQVDEIYASVCEDRLTSDEYLYVEAVDLADSVESVVRTAVGMVDCIAAAAE